MARRVADDTVEQHGGVARILHVQVDDAANLAGRVSAVDTTQFSDLVDAGNPLTQIVHGHLTPAKSPGSPVGTNTSGCIHSTSGGTGGPTCPTRAVGRGCPVAEQRTRLSRAARSNPHGHTRAPHPPGPAAPRSPIHRHPPTHPPPRP